MDGDSMRPRAAKEGTPWPMLSAFIECTGTSCLVTFAVSDIAPDEKMGAVILGIDSLTSTDGQNLTVFATFDEKTSVHSIMGTAPTAHPDAIVEIGDGAVSIQMQLPPLLDARTHPTAFCIIGGIPFQVDVPVVVVQTDPLS